MKISDYLKYVSRPPGGGRYKTVKNRKFDMVTQCSLVTIYFYNKFSL